MRDILTDLDRWRAEGKQIALATVLRTWGSAPRRPGAKLVVTSNGQLSGSVSGGCVENAVIEAALKSIKTDRPQLLHFGVADETAWQVGLSCGGSIDIFVKPLDEGVFDALRSAWMDTATSVLITVTRGSEHILGSEMLVRENGSVTGTIGSHRQGRAIDLAREVFTSGESKLVKLDNDTELFLEFIAPPPTLIAVGGVHIAVALMSLAKTLGYRTVVVDPRSVWGNEERFPKVDQLIQSWPEIALEQSGITNSTAVVILTHDPKLDDEALKIALRSLAFYVGALGSKSTNAKRRERLLSEGITGELFSRLRAPIGLDIHARTPEEIALAIMAQVVESYRKREQVPAAPEADLHLLSD